MVLGLPPPQPMRSGDSSSPQDNTQNQGILFIYQSQGDVLCFGKSLRGKNHPESEGEPGREAGAKRLQILRFKRPMAA